MEGMEGGRFYEKTKSGQEFTFGHIVQWNPPSSLVYTFLPGAIKEPTLVTITFTAQDDITVVHVHHAEGNANMGEQWPKRAARFTSSWDEVSQAFTTFCEEERC